MREDTLIELLIGGLAADKRRLLPAFRCDAELVRIDGRLWALSMDEFSAQEDRFGMADPARLGSNLAVATVSDVLAAGAEPAFYLHAVALPAASSAEFVEAFAAGISKVLTDCDCCLCGGDTGSADPWRYCGFAMGPVQTAAALTRQLPVVDGILWVTGRLGDANLAVLRQQPVPPFELRLSESRVLRRFALGCIDSSGGFADALWLLHQQSPGVDFTVDLDALPLAVGLAEAAAALGIPPEAALFGGAGEYELVFATAADLPPTALAELGAVATPIGRISPAPVGSVFFQRGQRAPVSMRQAPPCPRAASSLEQHVAEVLAAWQEISA